MALRFRAAGAPLAGVGAHTNFADESACLTADNVRNEIVNNSQTTGSVENAVLFICRYF
jgi:hypothetical protein